MTRSFGFLILLFVGFHCSDYGIAALPKALENGEVIGNKYAISGRTFDYLRNKISDKLATKLFSQRTSSNSENTTSADLLNNTFVEYVTNHAEDEFRSFEKNSKFFDDWYDKFLGIIPSFEIPHDPVAVDVETYNWTGNSTKSNRSLDSDEILTE